MKRAFFVKTSALLAIIFIAICATSCAYLSSHTHLSSYRGGPKPAVDLKVGEGFVNPLGYYESRPRFSWRMPDETVSKFQSAYQIQVTSSDSDFSEKHALWDSQKVSSSETSWVKYEGKALRSRQEIIWRVRYWNELDEPSNWSSINHVEVGLLDNNDWQALWIGHANTAHEKTAEHNPSTQKVIATPQYFRKTFNVSGKIKKARLYITAKGIFKPSINGHAFTDDVMTPGWTPYAKRIETLTYDVEDYLVAGENTLGIILAGGWYSGRVYHFLDRDHRLPPRVLAQLEITYDNDETFILKTDDTWQATQNGPIRFASNYDGEKYDQHLEMPGWDKPLYTASGWSQAIEEPVDKNVKLRPKRHTPVKTKLVIPAVNIIKTQTNAVIFDMGQNMVGVPNIRIPVIQGQEVQLRFAEALHKGAFYTDNYRSAASSDYYLPSKTGTINYQPTFTFHGYRYIEISGHDTRALPALEWVEGLVQYSDFALYSNFHSSHDKLNQLSKNIAWGLRGNFLDIPTDCPQRDERLGWTGDAQVFAAPSMYMADVYGFWSAWLESVREEQAENGMVPLYVPHISWLDFASSGWGDAATVIPWELYRLTGDIAILEDNYEMMQKWVSFHKSKSKAYISSMWSFADWLQPYPITKKRANWGDTNVNLISTAYFARSVALTLNTARVLHKPDDVMKLEKLHDSIRSVFRDHFFDEVLKVKDGVTTQTSYLLPLAFGLFNDADKQKALQYLKALIFEANTHLRTGFLGTPLLSRVLPESGNTDLMYELLFKETYPSWFHSINNDATTTWERWDSYSIRDGFNPQGMNSLNHYAYGTIARWFYEGILGIQASEAGFKRLRIAPQFGSQLSEAKGSYRTPEGEVSVDWKIIDDMLWMTVVIPKNTRADIVLDQARPETIRVNQQSKENAHLPIMLVPGTYQIEAEIILNAK